MHIFVETFAAAAEGTGVRRSAGRKGFERAHVDANQLVGGDAGPLLEAARLAVTMRRTGAGHLQRLQAGLPPDLPVLLLPELFTRTHGLRTTRQMAQALGEELGH